MTNRFRSPAFISGFFSRIISNTRVSSCENKQVKYSVCYEVITKKNNREGRDVLNHVLIKRRSPPDTCNLCQCLAMLWPQLQLPNHPPLKQGHSCKLHSRFAVTLWLLQNTAPLTVSTGLSSTSARSTTKRFHWPLNAPPFIRFHRPLNAPPSNVFITL